MLYAYFKSVLFCGLIFGLVSCKSESGPSKQKNNLLSVNQVTLINEDQSLLTIGTKKYDQIKATLGSQIIIDLNGDQTSYTQVNTSCFTDTDSYALTLETHFINRTSFPLKDLVPLESLKPSNEQIICDFELIITDKEQEIADIHLTEITLSNLKQVQDFIALAPSEEHYLLDEFLKITPQLPHSNEKAHLVCDDFTFSFLINSQKKNGIPLTAKELGSKNHRCRLVHASRDNEDRQLSEAFWIKHEPAKLTASIHLAQPSVTREKSAFKYGQYRIEDQELGRLIIENEDHSEAYIDIDELQKLKAQILGVYSSYTSSIAQHNEPLDINLDWYPSENYPTKTMNSKKYIIVPPQQFLSIIIFSKDPIICQTGMTKQKNPAFNPLNIKSVCQSVPVFRGLFIQWPQALQIEASETDQLQAERWQTIKIKTPSSFTPNPFDHFIPFSVIDSQLDLCQKLFSGWTKQNLMTFYKKKTSHMSCFQN